MSTFAPARGLTALQPYRRPATGVPSALDLAGNEGPPSDPELLRGPAAEPDLLRRYPRGDGLERALARTHGRPLDQVLVTAGADDGLLRVCLAGLERGRNAVLPVPTFEMIPRHVALAEGELRPVPWADAGPWPLEAVLERVDRRTGVVFVVSPNNPTGAVARAEDLRVLSRALLERSPGALLVLDGAYAEYAEHDLGPVVRELPNALELRTFSKAWGLAGLRVGYALGPAPVVDVLRRAGNPFPCAGLARDLAETVLASGTSAMQRAVARTRAERTWLAGRLESLGARPCVGQANFVLARFGDPGRAAWVAQGLDARGVHVRRFVDDPLLRDALRITCPADPADLDRLTRALEDL